MIYAGNVKTEGVIEKILFFNEENQFCVAQLKITQKDFDADFPITITGVLSGVQCGETLVIEGQWARHATYGAQIKVKSFQSKLPSSVYGIAQYLGSGLVEGIGKTYAKAIVDKFGLDTLKIIDTESARLREVKGIGIKRVHTIKKSWDEQKNLREVIMFLRTYGVGVQLCFKIVKKYSDDASRIVREEPYRLAREISGVGFKTADAIALNTGISSESKQRIEAGILYCLSEDEDEGHTCIPRQELERKATEMLQVDYVKCQNSIVDLIEQGELVVSKDGVLQLRSLQNAEKSIAESIFRIADAPSALPPIKFEIALDWAHKRAGFNFASAQAQAILSGLQNKVSVITGGPGTGKTTILKSICDILKAKDITPTLAAPTGRAAQRMSQSTGLEAKTLHRLLGFDSAKGKFLHDKENPLSSKFIIIDEASMLDTRFAAAVFSAIPSASHLILVGDINQLPSVGAGNVLKDIINSKVCHVAFLNEIFRQASRSQIVTTSYDILNGIDKFDTFKPTTLSNIDFNADVNFIEALNPEDCVEACVELANNILPKNYQGLDKFFDVQVLAPMHKGSAGISALNQALQDALNGKSQAISSGFSQIRLGDKLIQTRNNYDLDIYNGDMGKVVKISSEASFIEVDFEGKKVEIEKSGFSDLQTAYAISVHKSQGSEFPIVILPLLKQHFLMLQRNLLYTAITRGRRKVFIVGDAAAWSMAIKNSKSLVRRTALKERLLR